MKRFFGGKLLLAALVFATALFGFGCTEPPTAGGVTDRTDPNAPKTIESKELVGFYASFYLRGEWTPGKPLRAATSSPESSARQACPV